MLFNSIEFLLFLPTVFFLYWFVFKNQLRAQNVLLLVASYIFYGWWDWRFLSLIIASTFLDYFIAIQLGKTDVSKKRKFLLVISLAGNLGMLGFFKYYNFFVSSWIEAWSSVGITMEASTLNIILPVGISFYTFQTLSYTIDVYRKEMQPTKSFIDFAAFVTFFPQLVAGPIERASHLLPQFYKNRTFDYQNAVDGVKLIIWGMFKKVVVADNCAFFVNKIFENPEAYSSGELFVGMVFFAFQIYGDFSGYSDMAIGISKLFGFDLMVNFKFPYFSRDIAEFWRRWHISLSTWFRDYIYIPLGGSKGTQWFQIRNVMIIFLVSGFWHGANWTYVVWGLFHALMFLPLLLFNVNRSHLITKSYGWLDFAKIGVTFLVVCIGWVFFRADSIADAFQYLAHLFELKSLGLSLFYKTNANLMIFALSALAVGILSMQELVWVIKKRDLPKISAFGALLLVLLIFFMGSFKNQMDFIYFQF
ncbi:D-alanyl-lipoteichoic acid acyltransferase DltB (MBOAT superfamily) [Flavobacterium aquaticum]|uniref:D-alanyl-lipoteichoic acid acyltransferase DltB (MBOAT superfamily) n=1 Tax=Flavobacterium aquaticum TaxID=1236486 RepID=A0A327YQB0_9FLAO|nr:MBOAT family O-acyltransferase [Flavobacterium aquaticum]RAK22691.1 D-alanyl-lipoteichoic acid acyltransferase DltB (MBOAT superfamily) [Flavobacterium aquaticum]